MVGNGVLSSRRVIAAAIGSPKDKTLANKIILSQGQNNRLIGAPWSVMGTGRSPS